MNRKKEEEAADCEAARTEMQVARGEDSEGRLKEGHKELVNFSPPEN